MVAFIPSLDKQLTVYENVVDDDATGRTAPTETNAMILPVVWGPDGVQPFEISVEHGDRMWDHLRESIRPPGSPAYGGGGGWGRALAFGSSEPEPKLQVHTVGSYRMSIATSLADLDRIDADVFRLPDDFKGMLTATYPEGFGFLVCQFTGTGKRHPIAYLSHLHPRTRQMFAPTLHYHKKTAAPTPPPQWPVTHWHQQQNAVGVNVIEFASSYERPMTTFGTDGRFEFQPRPTPQWSAGDSLPKHIGVWCDVCRRRNFAGTRWKCGNCANYDLCDRCHEIPSIRHQHNPGHVYVELDRPVALRDNEQPLLRYVPGENVANDDDGGAGAPLKLESHEDYDHVIYVLRGVMTTPFDAPMETHRSESPFHFRMWDSFKPVQSAGSVPLPNEFHITMGYEYTIRGRHRNQDTWFAPSYVQ